MKIGAVTVGQAPRKDVEEDIRAILPKEAELIQRGALDHITEEELKEIEPEEGDYILVSRLLDGRQVRFAEKKILPRIQRAIEELEKEQVSCILMFCTGKFPEEVCSKRLLLYPYDLLKAVAPLLTKKKHLDIVVPSESQIPQSREHWQKYADHVTVTAASPYGLQEEIERAGKILAKTNGDLIILDCIGYSEKMKKRMEEITGKSVLLPRTLLARIAAEYVGKRQN